MTNSQLQKGVKANSTQPCERYTLARTDQPCLAFNGERLAVVSSRWDDAKEQYRWHDLAVYQTAGGNYVLAINYCTKWGCEPPHHHVTVLGAELSGLADALAAYNPVAHAKMQDTDRQTQLLENLRCRYLRQVSALRTAICDVEACRAVLGGAPEWLD